MATTFIGFPREPFRKLCEQLAGFPCIWDGDKEPFIGPKNGTPGGILNIDVTRIQKLGQDETREEWVPTASGGAGANSVEVGGQRIYYILFKFRSFSFERPGFDPLEDLRIKFRFASSILALQEMGVSQVGSGDVVPVAWKTDNREGYAAVCEFKFGFAPFQSVTDDDGGIIEQVNGDGTANKVMVGDLPFTAIE